MSSTIVNVTKASGEKQTYDESKLRRSLANAGGLGKCSLIKKLGKLLMIPNQKSS